MSALRITAKSYTALLRAFPELGAFDAARRVLEPGVQRAVHALHLQPYFRHERLARTDLRAAHALGAQRGEARLRRVLGAEHAERERPAIRSVLLHDEVILDRKRLQFRRLSQRRRPGALRGNEHPPARGFLGAPR